jgi:7-carboxy-7-deazaguanine synthase (Cx14CxxC type)
LSYAIKSLYFTLQGEGAHTGRAAVFLRFAGCNLWSGREQDRASAICTFCDTEFVGTDGPGGGKFAHAESLAGAVAQCWQTHAMANGRSAPFVVLTGGEPSLQADEELIQALHARGFEVAIESNGTRPLPEGLDWICISPKAGADLVVSSGDELKLVYPQKGLDPAQFKDLAFTHFFLQPMDGPEIARNTHLAAEYCMAHPKWRLGFQMHKAVGLP